MSQSKKEDEISLENSFNLSQAICEKYCTSFSKEWQNRKTCHFCMIVWKTFHFCMMNLFAASKNYLFLSFILIPNLRDFFSFCVLKETPYPILSHIQCNVETSHFFVILILNWKYGFLFFQLTIQFRNFYNSVQF